MVYSALPALLADKLRQFCCEFANAEREMKQHEVLGLEGMAVPALNEIRYATSHLTRALAADSDECAIKDVDTGIKHLQRASYDATDGAVLFALGRCQSFIEEYRLVAKNTVLPNYIDELKTVKRINNEIASESRNDNRRENYLEIKRTQSTALQNIFLTWDCAREELNRQKAQAEEQRLAEEHEKRGQRLLMWLGIGVSLALGLLTLIFK